MAEDTELLKVRTNCHHLKRVTKGADILSEGEDKLAQGADILSEGEDKLARRCGQDGLLQQYYNSTDSRRDTRT